MMLDPFPYPGSDRLMNIALQDKTGRFRMWWGGARCNWSGRMIACANVSILLLARGTSRAARETFAPKLFERDNGRAIMAAYRIFRLKDNLRAQFRQLPHVSGVTKVKVKDYEERGLVEAATPYAAWSALQGSHEDALQVGDVLMDEQANEIRIIKFVGFEPAEWIVPEVKLPGEMILGTAAGSPPPHSAS